MIKKSLCSFYPGSPSGCILQNYSTIIKTSCWHWYSQNTEPTTTHASSLIPYKHLSVIWFCNFVISIMLYKYNHIISNFWKFLWDWPSSIRKIFWKLFQVVFIFIVIPFILCPELYSIIWIYHCLFYYLLLKIHLSFFLFLVIMRKAALNIWFLHEIQVFAWRFQHSLG